jgi:hypothetical protein
VSDYQKPDPHPLLTLGVGVVLIVLCGWGFTACRSCWNEMGKAVPVSRHHDKMEAFVMSQDFVKQRLKSPKSADFPWYDQKFVTDKGDGQYVVVSYVDAKNSFGADLRANYVCELRYVGDNKWQCETCDIVNR